MYSKEDWDKAIIADDDYDYDARPVCPPHIMQILDDGEDDIDTWVCINEGCSYKVSQK